MSKMALFLVLATASTVLKRARAALVPAEERARDTADGLKAQLEHLGWSS